MSKDELYGHEIYGDEIYKKISGDKKYEKYEEKIEENKTYGHETYEISKKSLKTYNHKLFKVTIKKFIIIKCT